MNTMNMAMTDPAPLTSETNIEPTPTTATLESSTTGTPAQHLESLTKKQQLLINRIFETYPELSEVIVETFSPNDGFEVGGFYDLHLNENGKCTIMVFISEGGPELLKPLIDLRKTTVAINAQQLGLKPEEMTPELLQLFILAHEFGHVLDFVNNYVDTESLTDIDAVEEMRYHRENNLSALPVPFVYPPDLARMLEEHFYATREEIFAMFPSLISFPNKEGLFTTTDLLTLQEQGYRNSPPELYADTFARDFLFANAEYLDIPIKNPSLSTTV